MMPWPGIIRVSLGRIIGSCLRHDESQERKSDHSALFGATSGPRGANIRVGLMRNRPASNMTPVLLPEKLKLSEISSIVSRTF